MKSTRLSRCTFRGRLVTINYAKNAIEFCFGGQALEMLRAPLVTRLTREMRLNFSEVDQALEMLGVPPLTTLAREMRSKLRMRKDHSIAGKTIIQTTTEGAD